MDADDPAGFDIERRFEAVDQMAASAFEGDGERRTQEPVIDLMVMRAECCGDQVGRQAGFPLAGRCGAQQIGRASCRERVSSPV